MSAVLKIVACALACLLPGLARAEDTAQSLNERAMAAYMAKDYAGCARFFDRLINNPENQDSATVIYNAACCNALAGKPEQALALLDRASSLDMVAVARVEADSDLATARALPAWPALRTTLAKREEARLAGLDRALRTELLKRQQIDQNIRDRVIAVGQPIPQPLIDELARVDHDNTEWLKTVIAKHGWPGKSLVGSDGANAAWLFVQHADQDKTFQKKAILLLETAVARGEANGQQLAYLTDRILTGENKPQRYGTQFQQVDGKFVPLPIEDAAHVDERRAKLGMGTIADYAKLMRSRYAPAGGKSNDPE